MIHRILKMLGALGTNTGLTILTQLMLPPAFLHYYGVSRYGEWIVLSGTLTFLGTLNFGITTYTSNELTILHKRGEIGEFRRLQGSTLVLLICMVAIGMTVLLGLFFVPLGKWLHLTTMTQEQVTATAFLLGLQVLVNILAGYYNNLFMVVEQTHRGLSWNIARAAAVTLVCFTLTMFRLGFQFLALGQFIAATVITLLSIYDLKRRFGELPLGLHGANRVTAMRALKPSGMFAMILGQQVLVYQVPVNILQWMLGPSVVVLFNTSRTVLSAARQVLAPITTAIAPEITFSYANRDKEKMLYIFHQSERLVFAGIPIANLGVFLFAPIILRVWLHRPALFDLWTYGLMALISGAISMRDHKQYFQFSTNVHRRLSVILFFGNLAMIGCSIPLVWKFGLNGFLSAWLVSEVTQMVLIYVENRKLFEYDSSITLGPVVRLMSMMLVCLPACMVLVHYAMQRSMATLVVVAAAMEIAMIAASYSLFGLRDALRELAMRMRQRVRPA